MVRAEKPLCLRTSPETLFRKTFRIVPLVAKTFRLIELAENCGGGMSLLDVPLAKFAGRKGDHQAGKA
jgi:hypothetical protein